MDLKIPNNRELTIKIKIFRINNLKTLHISISQNNSEKLSNSFEKLWNYIWAD